jgi:hypothetical protein
MHNIAVKTGKEADRLRKNILQSSHKTAHKTAQAMIISRVWLLCMSGCVHKNRIQNHFTHDSKHAWRKLKAEEHSTVQSTSMELGYL